MRSTLLVIVLLAVTTTTHVALASSMNPIRGSAADSSPKFVIGFQSATGYIAAKLADLQSSDFVNEYNIDGLTVEANSNTLPSSGGWSPCPFVAVAEGILTYGSLSAQQNFFPYTAQGYLENGTTLSQVPTFFGFSNPPRFIGANWNASFASQLYTTSASNACGGNGLAAFWTVFIRADYVVATLGDSGVHPVSPDGQLATLADLQSSHFAEIYNAINGIKVFKENLTLNGCCVFRLNKDYLIVNTGAGVIEPFNPANGDDLCYNGQAALNGVVQLGLRVDGAFPNLNFTTRYSFTTEAASALPSYCASNPPQSLAIYKIHPFQAPTPAPQEHNCYKVSLRVSYYLPQYPICLADRWRYIMRVGETYNSITMSSIDECGFPVSMYGLTIKRYTPNHAVVYSTGGASNCPCNGSAIVPYNYTSIGEMTTVCQYNEGEFNWCDVLFQFDGVGNSIPCPPPPP
jgi:hypothetical protein